MNGREYWKGNKNQAEGSSHQEAVELVEDLFKKKQWAALETVLNPSGSEDYQTILETTVNKLHGGNDESVEYCKEVGEFVDERMKDYGELIGAGSQFAVYAEGPDRVRKLPIMALFKILRYIKWNEEKGDEAVVKDINKIDEITDSSIVTLRDMGVDASYSGMGSPSFFETKHGIGYDQDRLPTVGAYLEEHSFEENCRVIDSYIHNILALWRVGVADIVYNFSVNNGIRENGEVSLLDLGELSFSKEEVLCTIKDQSWLKRWSYNNLKDEALQAYFKEAMESRITPEVLENEWQKDVGTTAE